MIYKLKRSFPIFVFVCVLVSLLAANCAAAEPAEFRGAWITAWSSGYLTPAEVDATIAAAKKAKLNALFIQVRKNGDAYYTSATEPRGDNIAPDFDPLADVIQKAHAHGIQVHAWINTLRIWGSKGVPTNPLHVFTRHPEWVNKTCDGASRASEGLYLDPGIPEVREYLSSVVQEIAWKYNVDGIHLDYIRYPGKNWGYSELALNSYRPPLECAVRPEADDHRWLGWKRDQVTELVSLIRQSVKSIKPAALFSAATVAWGDCPEDYTRCSSYASLCQDWRRWTNEGLIDGACPMVYKDDSKSKSAAEFRKWLLGYSKWAGDVPVYVGIDIHTNQVPQTVRQIQAARKSGLHGFMLFSFNTTPKRDAIARSVGAVSR